MSSSALLRLTPVLICFLFLVVHAVSLPIQYDEAISILNLSEHGPLSAFTRYTDGTNNHVLVSAIIGILLELGARDIVWLRVPSLVAAAAVLVAVQRLARPLPGPLRLLLLFSVVATPLFHDYLVMARGYSLGLALLVSGWMTERPWRSGLLYALAIGCVPSFALDVVVLSLVRRDVWVAATAAVLSLLLYMKIFPDVVAATLGAAADGSAWAGFVMAMHGVPQVGWLVLFGVLVAIWKLRREYSLIVPALASMPLLFIGYPRSHLLAALLFLLVLFYSLPNRRLTIWLTFLACLASVVYLPQDRIASEPNTWPASGYSVARNLVSCLSVQKRGVFSAPADYYRSVEGSGAPLSKDCPYFLMISQPSLRIPAELRQHAQILSPYNVELYRRSDLDALLQERLIDAAKR